MGKIRAAERTEVEVAIEVKEDKGDSKNSDYYKAKNGLAWKGEHVDLDSVVGDYTKEAYEGIANGKYPAGMEDVIRNYFENLN